MLLFHNLPESFPIHLTGRPSFKDLPYIMLLKHLTYIPVVVLIKHVL